jgi:anti-anti-sigma factor
MLLKQESNQGIFSVSLNGRLDTFAANELREKIIHTLPKEALCIIFKMQDVTYISSAVLRLFLELQKKLKPLGGSVVLSETQDYCMEVLLITGLSRDLLNFAKFAEALQYSQIIVRELSGLSAVENIKSSVGAFKALPSSNEEAIVELLGDIRKIVHSDITVFDIYSKPFSETEFSIGVGGMGATSDECMNILGDFLTAGGAMVWLPTDGHDTPDFLLPRLDNGSVSIKAAFNINFPKTFNEIMHFKSSSPEGVSIQDFYKEIFRMSRERRKDYKGIVNLVMRANLGIVQGCRLKKAPIDKNRPSNAKPIIHNSNMNDWFAVDQPPLKKDVSALVCGMGISLSDDISSFNEDTVNKLVYMSPATFSARTQVLYNTAVLFNKTVIPDKPVDIHNDIASIIKDDSFTGLRSLMDASTITEAVIGINYIQNFVEIGVGEEHTVHLHKDHFTRKEMLSSYKKTMKK